VKANPRDKEAELVAQLQSALAAYKAGERCECGEPIRVIGSSQVGHVCFTCITGESVPDSDYEIDEACDKVGAR
jgi:hypothetical protein